MPPRSSSSAPAVDPIELLSQQIAPAVKRKESSIKLSPTLVKAVKSELKTVRTSKKYVSNAIVVAIVSAVDEHDETCSRFDSASFSVILQTLLQAKHSRQKERGLILLTASLYHDAHKTPPLKGIKVRKTAVGKESVLSLLSCFTNTLESPRIRRWAGVLLLELLEGCDSNRVAFESGPEDSKRMLGTMVLEEQNEILRITCGHLLRALISWNIPRENFWPVNTDSLHYEKFPVSSQSEKRWNNDFQTYIDDMFDSSKLSQSSGRLYFAQALVTSPPGNMISGGIINILVDREISICTQSRGTSFTKSLEIPFQLITGATLEETLLEGVASNKASAFDVVVELKASSELSCYINAVPVNIERLRITVKDEDVANDLGREFTGYKSTQKASQSRETIAISDCFHDPLCLEGHEAVEGSDKDLEKSYLGADVLQPGEDPKDGEQDVEFDNFVEESPQESCIRETDSHIKYGVGGPPEDVRLIVETVCEDNQVEADSRQPLQSSAPGRLSSHTEIAKTASADIENNQNHGDNIHDRPSIRNLRRKAPPVEAVPKTSVLQPSSDQDFEQMIEPVTNPVGSPIVLAQPKANFVRSKAKSVSKAKATSTAKQKAPKPKSLNEETQKVKKYSLGRKPKASIVRAAVTKQVLVPKTSAPTASFSKGGAKASAPKPGSTPKIRSDLVAKIPKKKISQSLVPKKPALITQHLQANFPELDLNPGEIQNLPDTVEGYMAKSLGLDAHGELMQEAKATDRLASRLSEALAAIDDIDQHDASFGEIAQTSLVYQPSQATSQPGSLCSPALAEDIPVLAYARADSPGIMISEGVHIVSKDNKNSSLHVGVLSQSSPSSLERVSPIPLPAQEASHAECFIPEAVIAPSKNIVGPTGLRRSPRLASRYSSREASVAPGSAQPKAPRPVRKLANMDRVDCDEPRDRSTDWDDDTPSKAVELPLFDDRLARKTPLISFSAKGPRNQGINSSKKFPLQSVTRRRQITGMLNRLLQTQQYTSGQSSKRKLDKESDPVVEDNKRQQTSRLEKSQQRPFRARKESPVVIPSAEILTAPRNPPAARNTARLGSQGSRVNENGSPRGNSSSLGEQIKYEAIARKVLMDENTTIIHGQNNGNSFIHCDNDEGLNLVESDHGFVLNLPGASSTSYKVQPLSPRPNEEVIMRYLPRAEPINVQYGHNEEKVVHQTKDNVADPFLEESPEKDLSSFARRLQYRRHTPIQKAREAPATRILRNQRYNMNEDPEATLVNVENERPVGDYSSSSDSTSGSSDGEQDQGARKAAVQTQHVQCDEWRMALKPHQRGILDILNQVSADLVRHLISHEEAVEDVLTEYEQGSMLLIKDLEKTHQDDRRRIQHELDKIKRIMINEYREARLEISRINKPMRGRTVRELEKEWMQEQDQMQRIIEEGMKKCK